VTQGDASKRRRAIVTAIVLVAFALGVYFLTFWRYAHQ
jgi:flagellar basal body-associated protein FliL